MDLESIPPKTLRRMIELLKHARRGTKVEDMATILGFGDIHKFYRWRNKYPPLHKRVKEIIGEVQLEHSDRPPQPFLGTPQTDAELRRRISIQKLSRVRSVEPPPSGGARIL